MKSWRRIPCLIALSMLVVAASDAQQESAVFRRMVNNQKTYLELDDESNWPHERKTTDDQAWEAAYREHMREEHGKEVGEVPRIKVGETVRGDK